MDLSKFKADRTAEDEGVWVALDGDDNGAQIKLARIGNRRYREAMQRRMKPYRRALRAGTLDETTAERSPQRYSRKPCSSTGRTSRWMAWRLPIRRTGRAHCCSTRRCVISATSSSRWRPISSCTVSRIRRKRKKTRRLRPLASHLGQAARLPDPSRRAKRHTTICTRRKTRAVSRP